MRKSVKLKLLTRIEAYVDSPGQQEYFELAFAQVRVLELGCPLRRRAVNSPDTAG